MSKQFRRNLRLVFGADMRSLAAFRIALGLVLIADLITRVTALEAHYTDNGVLPRAALIDRPTHALHLSLCMLNGDAWFQALLFGVAGLAALAMILGWYTQVATFVAWLLYASIVSRNEIILQGSDTVLRVFLFWSMFLPLSARWSIDRLCSPLSNKPPGHVLSSATAAVQIQVVLLFTFSALLKTGVEWWPQGTAVYYALHWDHLATPFADILLKLPSEVLKLATFGVLLFEFFAPLVLFIPWHVSTLRSVGLLAIAVLLVGFALSFRLGVWPFAAAAMILPIVPSTIWDRLSIAFRGVTDRFDAEEAGRRIRSMLGERPLRVETRSGTNILIAVFLLYVLWWNVGTVQGRLAMPRWAYGLGNVLRIDQRWDMFAPRPSHYGGWWVIEGERADGRQEFLLPEAAHDGWGRPEHPADIYASHRWRLYMWQMLYPARRPYLPFLAQYLCRRESQGRPPEQWLVGLTIYYMKEETLRENLVPEPERQEVLKYRCNN